MERRKQPSFFDERVEAVQKLSSYNTVELFIETLTGTCFEIRVSLFDTVLSVKAKIQRLEGVPIGQQHLIWNDVELENDRCLHHYSISEGCTLRLVLAMRGGPINTRRVPTGESVLEATDDLDAVQQEPWERTPSSKQFTFLVYRHGEKLNLFGIVDRGNGTLTPVPELMSTGPVFSLHAEDAEEVGQGKSLTSPQQTLENSITMKKMKQLKAKMENMNLYRKKTAKLRSHLPEGPRPCSSTLGPRLCRVLPKIHQLLPPAGATYASEAWECPVLEQTQTSSEVSQLEFGQSRLPLDRVFSVGQPGSPVEGTESKMGGVQLVDESVLMEPQQAQPLCMDLSAQTLPSPASPLPQLPGGMASTETQLIGAERFKLPPLRLPSEPAVHTLRGTFLKCIQGSPLQAEAVPRRGSQGVSERTGRAPMCLSRGGPGSLLAKVSNEHSAQLSMPECALGTCGGPSGPVRRTAALSCSLPPVKTPAAPKKKNIRHCSLCGKRTGLASSYECRCGNNFCASHRYPEAHGCSFDYKGVGRRMLQDSHPVVSTPKLPKI